MYFRFPHGKSMSIHLSCLLMLCFFLPSLSYSQESSEEDSLISAFANAKADTLKAQAVQQLCMNWSSNQPDSCIVWAEKGLLFTRKNKLNAYTTSLLKLEGVAYVNKGNYEKSLELYLEGLDNARRNKDLKEEAAILNNIGVNFWYQNDFVKAKSYYEQSLTMRLKLGNKKDISKSYNNLGNVSVDLKDYELALQYYEKALALKKEIGDQIGTANCYNNIGIVNEELHKPDLALVSYEEALKLFIETGDERGQIVSLNNIAIIHKKKQEYGPAIENAKKSLVLAQQIDDKEDIKNAYEILSQCNWEQNNFQEAYRYNDLFSKMKDTLYSIGKTEAIQEMEQKYKAAENEQQIKFQKIVIEDRDKKIENDRLTKYGLIILATLLLLLSLLAFNRYIIKKRAGEIITAQKIQVEQQKKIVEEQHKDIVDSINYAQRIQQAVLPSPQEQARLFPDSFVFNRPRDIVSGDFWWVSESGGAKMFAVGDCTGHGVPGAFMSLIGNTLLNEIVKEKRITDPGIILNFLNAAILQALKQRESSSDSYDDFATKNVKDGMDIAFCVIDEQAGLLMFAGANNSLVYISNGKLTELKGDRQPIGFFQADKKPFQVQIVPLKEVNSIYMFSDGFSDQFGGENGKKFKLSRLKEEFLAIHTHTTQEQKEKLAHIFENWKGKFDQVDDVLVAGIKLS